MVGARSQVSKIGLLEARVCTKGAGTQPGAPHSASVAVPRGLDLNQAFLKS